MVLVPLNVFQNNNKKFFLHTKNLKFHFDELRKFDETVAKHVPTIEDNRKSKDKIDEAKEAIRDAWDNEYRQGGRARFPFPWRALVKKLRDTMSLNSFESNQTS